MSVTTSYDHVQIANSVVGSEFLASPPPPRSLRVCCYGSSSSITPEKYLQEARHVGYLLAKRGHICVNGAGSYGCMAGLNDGACKGNGHIVGVIHEMWLVDGEDSNNSPWTNGKPVRDGGAHGVFDNHRNKRPGSPESVAPEGPIREMLIAGGSDLQERKRLLMEGADALLVLPGGPGTWDELWEAACARGIGLSRIPIVVINADGYYDPFLQMMRRAYDEGLTKLEPDELIHFEESAEGAVRWIESVQQSTVEKEPMVPLKPRESRTVVRKSSMMTLPPLGRSDSWFFGPLRRSFSRISGQASAQSDVDADDTRNQWLSCSSHVSLVGLFSAGVAVGVIVNKLLTSSRVK